MPLALFILVMLGGCLPTSQAPAIEDASVIATDCEAVVDASVAGQIRGVSQDELHEYCRGVPADTAILGCTVPYPDGTSAIYVASERPSACTVTHEALHVRINCERGGWGGDSHHTDPRWHQGVLDGDRCVDDR